MKLSTKWALIYCLQKLKWTFSYASYARTEKFPASPISSPRLQFGPRPLDDSFSNPVRNRRRSIPKLEYCLYMLVSKRLLLRPCQQMGCLEHVLDLSAIQRHSGQCLQLFIREYLGTGGAGQELLPDMATGSHIQIGVDDGDVNSGFKGGVDVFSAIGSQEEDSLDDKSQYFWLDDDHEKGNSPHNTPACGERSTPTRSSPNPLCCELP
jgi:hypothetical protein